MGEKTFPFPDADASLQLMEAETLFYAVHNCSITKPPKHICMATSGLEEQIQFQEEQIPTFVRTRGGRIKGWVQRNKWDTPPQEQLLRGK